MGVVNMLGVFIFMIVGVIIGFLVLILEWFTVSLADYSTSNVRIVDMNRHMKTSSCVGEYGNTVLCYRVDFV